MSQAAATRALGGYEVLYELKAGGMGEVLLARRMGSGGFEKLVAVKTIRGELRGSAALRTMFFDEAQLLARLDHPAIAQVYDFGEDGDALYLAMEYVAGLRFRELAALRPPPGVAARAVAEALRGLHAAHELTDLAGHPLGVVHRDVTPENLMLTFDGHVKVLDFGIALVRGRRAPVTELGLIKGKPPYLSPEQVKNQPLDRRSDVFSACLVLHELLTGEPVFDGDSVYAIARAIEHDDIPPPSARAGSLPPGLDEILRTGLARDPAERFASAGAVAAALDAVAAAAGAEPLAAYAARALAGERDRHRAWLHELLAERSSALAGGARGRPSGRVTVRGPALDRVRLTDAVVALEAAGDATPEATAGAEADVSSAPRRGRGRLALVVAGLLAVAAGLLITRWFARAPARSADRGVVAEPTTPAAVDAGPPASRGVVALAGPAVNAAVPVAPAPAPDRPVPSGRRRPPASTPDAAPRPAPAPAPPTPTGEGFLTVAAEPFAVVRIDGVDAGSTPFFRRRLAAGEHEIVLASPDTGEIRLRKRIRVETGEHEEIILRP